MRQSSPALIALVLGLATGVGIGFVLGSDDAAGGPVHAMDADPSTVVRRRAASPDSAADSTELAATSASAPRVVDSTPADAAALSPLEERRASELGTEAARRVAAAEPTDEVAEGAGVIHGEVVDQYGNAVEDADVVVVGSNFRGNGVSGSSTDKIGRGFSGFDSLADEVDEYAKQRAAARKRNLATKTDAGGAFRLEGLRDGRHYVKAYADGHVFDGSYVRTGDAVRFSATPVGVFELEVRMPNGTVPESAIVIGLDSDGDETAYEWSPDAPEVRLAGRERTLRVLGGDVMRLRWDRYVATFRSEERLVDLEKDGAGPHVFDLVPANLLRVTVKDESTMLPRIKPWVSIVAEGDEGDGTKLKRHQDGPFLVADLEPGRYELKCGRGQGDVELEQSVELVAGLNEVELTLGDVDADDYLVLKCHDDSGRPIGSIDVRYEAKSKGSTHTGGLRTVARPGGEHWVHRGEFTKHQKGDEPPKITLTVEAGRLGTIKREIDPNDSVVDFVFSEPCNLTVQVTGMAGRQIRLVVESLEDAQPQDAEQNGGWRHFNDSRAVGPDGRVAFGKVQPGRVKILAMKGDNRWVHGRPVGELEVALRAGDETVTLALPELYELVVYAPDSEKGEHFGLQRVEGDSTDGGWYGGQQIGDDQRVRFKDLVAGKYVINNWSGNHGQMTVTVPGPEVTFVAEKPNAVKIVRVTEGKALANAGARAGDILLFIGQHEAKPSTYWSRLQLALMDGDTTLTVARGGSERVLTVPQIESEENLWNEVGAQFANVQYP